MSYKLFVTILIACMLVTVANSFPSACNPWYCVFECQNECRDQGTYCAYAKCEENGCNRYCSYDGMLVGAKKV
ncbi:unnamed protein product [Bursaphelenchus xylophilus]|uniref:(pine wood nematode) hypothetical protein n=1 Tax=Bursaphelenchus xylophilus TaxID=6326 RepID=A0A1I7SUW2_BURXY|nr:unnamed protein product [Bursaphelenchus xylophilus]CAG9125818.1 unnamed protein product [Bursaphelenchus xylophilus]